MDGRYSGGAGGITIGQTPSPGSVHDTLAKQHGWIPHVMLRDPVPDTTPSRAAQPTSWDDATLRYRIDGEIARGGMGAILKGRDPDLGRDVAIKVLHDKLNRNPEIVRRFVEEAQIGGQLQHPGVVPVYELGTFSDERPFFSMKLVKGQTLAALLAARSTPADDQPRFLSIFEAIAQTMAYSHARGVIHRDLKPSNVMVGSFGEVQVMDWGLAKVLAHGDVKSDARAGRAKSEEGSIATARSEAETDYSHAGSIMGTPSYMAPEQARGEKDRIDERADVFALGSILCEILTRKPAFTGHSSEKIIRKAEEGDTAEAVTRLDGCGAEAEMIALAKVCLAARPEDRPPNAGVVAGRITSYLAGVQERVQAAERERAVAVARAIEERRRRKVQLALTASVLALTILGGLSTTYYLQQRSERARRRTEQVAAIDRVVSQAMTLRDQALARPEDLSRWEVAMAAIRHAEATGGEGPASRLLGLRAEVQSGFDAAKSDQELLDRLVDIRSAKADDPGGWITHHDYSEAFREAGIDLTKLPHAEAGSKIRARPPAVAVALAGALDDWAATRRHDRGDPIGAAHLRGAASVADPDPWRTQLRNVLAEADNKVRVAGLQTLANKADFQKLGAISLQLLGAGMANAGDLTGAESVLRRAQQRYPRDVWVNYELAAVLEKLSRRDEAIRFYTAARAVRPETAHDLAHALEQRGESDEAIAIFRDLSELRRGNARHLACLGLAMHEQRNSPEAIAVLDSAAVAYRKAIELRPDDASSHYGLGNTLQTRGKLDEAIAAYRRALAQEPDNPAAYTGLGVALQNKGKIDEAVAVHRKAAELAPERPEVQINLGSALQEQGALDEAEAAYRKAIEQRPDIAYSYFNLGRLLKIKGKLDEAAAAYRRGIELRPDNAPALLKLGELLCDEMHEYRAAEGLFRKAIALRPDVAQGHYDLGNALDAQRKFDEAVASYRRAIKIDPNNLGAISNLGAILCDEVEDYPAAEALFRRAIALRPKYALGYFNLGNALQGQGQFDEAAAAYRRAIEIDPDYAVAHSTLGIVLEKLGDHRGSLAEHRKGHELGSKRPDWPHPSAQWVAEAERLLAQAERLPAVLQGTDKPKDNAERLAFAQLCNNAKHYAFATRLLAEALEVDPRLGNNRQTPLRYNAACAAALAASGQGKDDPRPDDNTKAKLRAQSLGWLKAELSTWKKLTMIVEPGNKELVVKNLTHWKQDVDLASVRDEKELAKLPETEREAWKSLWADAANLLKRAEKPAR